MLVNVSCPEGVRRKVTSSYPWVIGSAASTWASSSSNRPRLVKGVPPPVTAMVVSAA